MTPHGGRLLLSLHEEGKNPAPKALRISWRSNILHERSR